MVPAHAIAVKRRYWRMLAPRWSHQPLSGEGAARHGGRYNLRGIPALYMSEDFTTAVAEYEQDLGIRPGTLCAYDVGVEGIADLTDAAFRLAYGVPDGLLHAPWKQQVLIEKITPPSWLLVERLMAEGYAGLRAPSVQTGGSNLVLWRWNDRAERRVVALDPLNDLPTKPPV